MTLSDIRSEVSVRLNEVAAAGLWSTAELNTRINSALLRLYMDAEPVANDTDINLRQNVAWYLLPTNCLVPNFLFGPAAWLQQKLFPTQMIALDQRDYYWERRGNSIPTHFIPFSWNRFILWPPPNVTTTCTLNYTPIPTTLSSDSDTTGLHLPAQKLISIYASYLCLRKENIQRAQLFLGEYKSRLLPVLAEQRNATVYHTTKIRPAGKFEKAHGSPRWGRP